MMNPAMLMGIGGVAALLLISGKSKAAAPGTATVTARMRTALATGNPATIRALATQLRSEGFTTQAADLERAASQLEALAPAPSSAATGGLLKRGSTGREVFAWQGFLRSQGYSLVKIDGVFGVQTEDATRGFQKSRGLTADGIVGPETLRASKALAPAAAAAAPPAPAVAPTPTRPPPAVAATLAVPKSIQRGSTGPEVLAWQGFLRSQGYTIVTTDGVFGVQTEDSTKAFQRSRALTADGIVGPATLAASLRAAPSSAPPPPVVKSPGIAAVPSNATVTPPTIAASPAPAAPPTALRTLSKGTSGSDVLAWQTFLHSQGFTAVAIDGVFGPQTDDATKAFQRSRALTADGIVGPATLRAAATAPPAVAAAAAAVAAAVTTITASAWRLLKRGASGNDVREWQTVLAQAGYPVVPDGIFGAGTETATKAWQASRKLTADGIVGAGAVASLRAMPPANVRVAGDFATASPLPGVLPAAAPPLIDVSYDRSLAAQLTLHLHTSIPGSEDRDLVEQFQRLMGLNATGSYGPGTARALMRFGQLPPKPYYWPSQGSQREKSNYREALKREAARDPARAREWSAAASRV